MKISRTLTACGLALAGVLLVPPTAAVEPIDFEIRNNADLAAVCSTPPSDPIYVAAIHFCHGVGVGFVRYHDALKEGKPFSPLFCFPAGVTRTQALNEYVRYSKAHPEYDRDLVGDVMIKFLIETYPCPSAGR